MVLVLLLLVIIKTTMKSLSRFTVHVFPNQRLREKVRKEYIPVYKNELIRFLFLGFFSGFFFFFVRAVKWGQPHISCS